MLDWLACWLVRVLGWIVCHLPPSVCVAIGSGLGWLASWCQPKRMRIGYANLTAAFGDRFSPATRRKLVRNIFQHLSAGLIEMLRLPVLDRAYIDRYVQIIGYEHIDVARASGRPVVFLTGHYGNWELNPIVAALLGHPIVALARAQDKLPKLYRLLVSYRESKGCRIVHKGGAMQQLLNALERREFVGIVGDQASRQGIFIDFFGRPALFTTGPFELARRSQALIVPTFIHRVRGPFHQIVVEPPIDLSQRRGSDEAVTRWGIEQFAGVLRRHIEDDPAQWLWLHKRWKHTSERRVMVLSDGKLGHLKQSLVVVEALRAHAPVVRERVIEVRYRNRFSRIAALAWAWCVPARLAPLACLRWVLEPACFTRVASTYADVVVSCGSSAAPINLLVAAEDRAKSVVVMRPRPLPLRRFDLAFVPIHDRPPQRPNVVQMLGALNAVHPEELLAAREQLQRHARVRTPASEMEQHAVITVLLGGETPEYTMTTQVADALIRHVLEVCEEVNGTCLVTTSRRTPAAVERLLSERLTHHPRCGLLLLASRDQLNGTLPGMLGWAHVVVVTGESVSMVSEACASGRPVVVVDLPRRGARAPGATKAARFIHALATSGYVQHHPLPEVGRAIRRSLRDRQPVQRLDSTSIVRDAVARLVS